MLDVWLENLAKHLSQGRNPSSKLRFDIENYKDSFLQDKQDSPSSAKKLDTKLRLSRSPSPSPLSKKTDFIVNIDEPEANMEVDSGPSSIIMPMATEAFISANSKLASLDNNCSDHKPSTDENACDNFIRELSKSPHLNKDFSPNGERLRNSLRFRRQERLQKQRSLRSLANLISQKSTCSWDSENFVSSSGTEDFDSDRSTNYFNFPKLPLSDANNIKPMGKKSKPYGEKGFIIHVNDGSLTLNDVKDLNNCYSDDFDSSCDTSLNYIDPDSLNVTIEVENTPKTDEYVLPKTVSPFDLVENDCKYSLEEVRENLNKCKSKLDALEIVDVKITKKPTRTRSKHTKLSLNDVICPTKNQFEMVAKPTNISVFTRLHPVASPILNSRSLKIDQQKKTIAKRNESQNGTSNTATQKNYSKNTLAFIEKINDTINDRHSMNDRHQKPQQPEKKGINKKTTPDPLTRKPPAPTSPKKQTAAARNSDKQKNKQTSPTRKRL